MAGGQLPKVGVIMGSQSDWPILQHAADLLEKFGIPHERRIISAHRTPERLYEYARTARERGLAVVIAGAGGAAHLPGMTAAMTTVPVFAVPIPTTFGSGIDSLLSIVQMPAGIPVGTLAVGKAGAINAALLAVAVLSGTDAELEEKLRAWRKTQTEGVAHEPDYGA